MEVCGGHTMAIHKYGIKSLLPDTIRLLSGPGCPVCVTGISCVDKAVALARRDKVCICTYGDLVRVPGTESSLKTERASGADVRILYSPLDAVEHAADNPDVTVVFLGIGFETTTPASAAAVLEAEERELSNFYLLAAHKTMKPAMTALIDENTAIDAYLCPGHVSVITGLSIYEGIASDYKKACVVAGFEPADILYALLVIVKQLEEGRSAVFNAYPRAVKPQGNQKARDVISRVFKPCDATWRGLGSIPGSGLAFNDVYSRFDAENLLEGQRFHDTGDTGSCRCGEVLKGLITPEECPLYGKACTPAHPRGACMVSSEGSCAACYRYGS